MMAGRRAHSWWRACRRYTAVLLIALGITAKAGYNQAIDSQPSSGVSIEITNALENLPTRGFSPLRITISNQSGAKRTWRFEAASSHSYGEAAALRWSGSFTVDNQDVREFDVLVPVPVVENSMYPRLNIRVSGHGMTSSSNFFQSSHYNYFGGNVPVPFIGMSQEFAAPNKSRIEEYYESSKPNTLKASVIRSGDHRSDPMAYAGFDVFWITPQEWRTLPQRSTSAITQWVNLGGRLIFATRPEESLDNLPGLPLVVSNTPKPFGMGSVLSAPTSNGLVQPETFLRLSIRATSKPDDRQALRFATREWLVRIGLDESTRPKALILTLVIIFAVLIGPVNLWMAHKKKRPAAVLWVTPMLSVGCSIAMALVIVVKDGFGGRGVRSAMAFIQPDTATMAVVQEQASKTGVLIAPAFSLSPSALIETRFSGDEVFPEISMSLENNRITGSTFSSRTSQTHLIERIEPTRSRVEIFTESDGTVTVLSSINTRLDTLLYHDPDGQWWRAVDVATGVRKPMESISGGTFQSTKKAFEEKAGPEVVRRLAQVASTKNLFFGFTSSGSEIMAETLPAIRWQQDHALWIGPATRAGGSR